MPRSRIVLSNSYGTANVGDEAILTVLAEELAERDCHVDILTFTPDDTAAKHRGARAVRSGVLSGALETFHAIRNADALVVGGGGILQDATSFGNLLFHVSRTVMARVAGTPFVISGVGVGPLKRRLSRRLTLWACSKAQSVDVRDDYSAALLHEIGVGPGSVQTMADFAHLLPAHRRDEMEPQGRQLLDSLRSLRGDGRKLIGLSLRPPVGDAARRARLSAADQAQLDEMARLADALVEEHDAELVLLSMHPEQDDRIAELLLQRMDLKDYVTAIPGRLAPKTIKGVIADLDLVVGTRLHSLIFAASHSVPLIALAYDAKVAAYAESLGLGELVLPPKDWAVETVTETSRRALGAAPGIAAQLSQAVPARILAARESIDKICALAHAQC